MSERESADVEIDLQKYLEILLRRRWIVLAATLTATLATSLVVFTATPIYKAKALLLIEKSQDSNGFSESRGIERSQEDYYQTQYMLLTSASLLEKVYEELRLDRLREYSQPQGVEKLRRDLNIAPVKRTRLVHVEALSPDPELAARISNAVARAYTRQNLENQLFISKEILQALAVDSKTAEGRRLQESLPAVVNNQLIQQLKSDYTRAQSQSAQLANRYTAKHPERLAVEANLRSLANQIRAETEHIVQALKTELSGQLKGNNVRLVDPAKVPTSPFKPRKFRAVAITLIAGLMAGTLLALVIDSLDQTVRTQEDVERKLHQPFLGLVPYLDLPNQSRPYDALRAPEPSLSGEAFRNLRTLADFANVAEKERHLLVTSSVQEEGKTYVATNLAVSFAQLGEKVLIIDGDLRRPQIHKNFGLSRERGISDFLATGRGVEELESIVQETDIPTLNALPCGTRPPNPSELLNTPRLSALLAWAKQRYDRIVVDCTPLFPIHDTLLWGRHIRAAVFVVRYGRTRVPLVQDALQRLSGVNVKVLGISVNAATPSGLTYAGYGYYYRQYYRHYREPVTTA